jgi:hypothetical protein
VRASAARWDEPSRIETDKRTDPAAGGVISALVARLNVEADPSVRGAIGETIGRVASSPEEVQRASAALVSAGSHEVSIDGRLGIASGYEALVRLHRSEQPLSEEAIAMLRGMVSLNPPGLRVPPDPARNVRVRRVALEALVTADAVDEATLDRAIGDPDPQVRRLAMRAAATAANAGERLTRSLTDSAPMVRIGLARHARRAASTRCAASVIGTGDGDTHWSRSISGAAPGPRTPLPCCSTAWLTHGRGKAASVASLACDRGARARSAPGAAALRSSAGRASKVADTARAPPRRRIGNARSSPRPGRQRARGGSMATRGGRPRRQPTRAN